MMRNIRWYPALVCTLVLLAGSLAPAPEVRAAAPSEGSGLMAPAPPPRPVTIKPAMREEAFSPAQAYNYSSLLDHYEIQLSPAQEAFLNEHRFLLLPVEDTTLRAFFSTTPAGFSPTDTPDDMLMAYESIGGGFLELRWPYNTKLVTPDIVLHAFFRFVQNSLKFVETEALAPSLSRFLENMLDTAVTERQSAPPEQRERWNVVLAQLTAAWVLMANSSDDDSLEQALRLARERGKALPEELSREVEQELRLVFAAEAMAPSPLFGRYETGRAFHDYTMYTPRGHYTQSGLLRAYFRCMTFLGRQAYVLEQEQGMADAILLAGLIRGNDALNKDWSRIMAVTSFYAGQPDDVSVPEFSGFLAQAAGSVQAAKAMLGDQAALLRLVDRVEAELPAPRILSEVVLEFDPFNAGETRLREKSMSFRIFGQRFNLDGWVLGELTKGEDSGRLLPRMPSALFLPAAYGDDTARSLCDTFVLSLQDKIRTPEQLADFHTVLDGLRRHLAELPDEQHFSSLGSAWLSILSTLTGAHGKGHPLYMQSQAYPLKQIQTFLGSYTEYKHAFQLYQKQLMVEKGDPGPPAQPPVPRGFVTPNLRFWYAFLRVLDYARTGFTNMGFDQLENWPQWRLEQFISTMTFFTSIAEKELTGAPILEAEYERIRVDNFGYMASPFDPTQTPTIEDKRSPVISDIATVVSEQEGGSWIVYEATGKPYAMLALLGNEDLPRLAIGLAYNHFEFLAPHGGQRFTKKDWQWKVYEAPDILPEKNFWYAPLLAP